MKVQARWRGQALDAILFDLDGTLLDTAGDIHAALNRALTEFRWEPMSEGAVRHMIGRGAPILIERTAAAQGRALDEPTQAALVERFFHHYGALQENDEFGARPYAGVGGALETLHGAGLRTAIVTNKQQRFAIGLLHRLHLKQWIDVVVGGDSCERRKPDPQPLLFACERLGVSPSRALMVGDSINDVEAARAAQIAVVCVPYGYNEGNDPRDLPCDQLIEDLSKLPPLVLPGTDTSAPPASPAAT
jgi:phosphoglycolate phosphatase